jgi:nucleoside-diphosphate-sugar epimerase
MMRLLIAGTGDIAARLVAQNGQRARFYGLARKQSANPACDLPVAGDLDTLRSLSRLASMANAVLHFAPPPPQGKNDSRTRHLLAALSRRGSLPRCLIYISTSGVYGDCGGEWLDETRPPAPQSPRGQRRLDAERQLRRWGARTGVRVVILRAPGIYAADRLPKDRLEAGTPVLLPHEDSYSNHIHADDLARAAWLALFRGRANRVYHACDDTPLKMGEYFRRVAHALNLPPPPEISRSEAETCLSPMLLSFLRESRRLSNRRLRHELRMRLMHPEVSAADLARADTRPQG